MGSRTKNKGNDSTPPPPATEESPTASDEASAADATPSQVTSEKLTLQSLFAAYEESDAALNRAKSEFDLASHTRSQTVKAIYHSSVPPRKGPFRYKGNIVTIVCRTNKATEEGGAEYVTYYFKGQRQGVLDVD